ncbi:hypothetical protein [Paracoccus actinidiae]|uniref:hypothetical protein n=1 Tax=Paracoccus actinidiae TaxID=3064531 RepID=UPI0027D2AD35|nr:hypothetical protein [Paracoccus sp. M09]
MSHFDDVDFGPIKEYHVWDGLSVPEFSEFNTRTVRITPHRRLRHLWRGLTGRPQEEIFLRRRLQADPDRYFDFFAGLLAQDGIRMTGDITPSYSALPVPALRAIRDGFACCGIRVRTVFLMRDPVERCLSAIRMYKRGGRSRHGVDVALPDDQMLLHYLETDQALLRTDYPATLARLEAVFGPDEILTGFYESMFEPDFFMQLNRFFGCTPDPDFIARRFNSTERGADIPDELRARAAGLLRPIYLSCAERFPEARRLWAHSLASL